MVFGSVPSAVLCKVWSKLRQGDEGSVKPGPAGDGLEALPHDVSAGGRKIMFLCKDKDINKTGV